MVKGVCFLPLPLGDARGGRECGRGVGGVRGWNIEKRKLPDLNQSERLRAHAPSAANFATQKFAPVHASHEQGVLGKYSRGKEPRKSRSLLRSAFFLSLPNNIELF